MSYAISHLYSMFNNISKKQSISLTHHELINGIGTISVQNKSTLKC